MNPVSCVIVDDEPLAVELLRGNVKQVDWLELRADFTSSKKALDFLVNGKVDLLFLDIQMPGLTGIELSRMLDSDTLVIFTTAFEHYAVESYHLNALDYLLKPIDQDRFRVACEKARVRLELIRNQVKPAAIQISSEHEKFFIQPDELMYIEGLKDYVKLFLTTRSKPLLTRLNLKAMEELLPPGMFKRVHKSYIVNRSKITRMTAKSVYLNAIEIPLGGTYKSEI